VPHFITSKKRSFYLGSRGFSWFDFRGSLAIGSTSRLAGGIFAGEIKEITKEYQDIISGNQRDVPDWVGDGLIVGVQGGQDRVEDVIDEMLFNEIQVTAVWIQGKLLLRAFISRLVR
jgi:sulfoquinovosidase